MSEVRRGSVEDPGRNPSNGLLIRDGRGEEREDGHLLLRTHSDSLCTHQNPHQHSEHAKKLRKRRSPFAQGPRVSMMVLVWLTKLRRETDVIRTG